MPRPAPSLRRVARGLVIVAACGLLPVASAPAGCPCGSVADEQVAAVAGLEREWIVQTPLDAAASRLAGVTVGDGLVVATSNAGGVHAIRGAWSAPRLAFPGVENHPEHVFFLHVVERAADERGQRVAKARLFPVTGPDAFAIPSPRDAGPAASIAAVTLLAMPVSAYEKLPPNDRQALAPDRPDVLHVAMAVDGLTAGRHHLRRYGVTIDERGLTVAPRFEPAGTIAWSSTIGAAAGHAWSATIGSRLVVVASETAVHALDRATGIVDWERPTGSLTGAPALQAGGWVYVPLATNRILRLPANPRGGPVVADVPPAASAPGRRPAKAAATPSPPEAADPVTIDAGGGFESELFPLDAGVLWVSHRGLAALERTTLGWVRHELPESSPPTWERRQPLSLAGAPAVRDGEIYLATSAGTLMRVDLNAENRPGLRGTWSALLPDRAAAGPLVSGDVVLVSLGPAGMAAFSARDGRELWRSDLVGTLVATAGGRAWVLDTVGRLTALDISTGSRRQSLCVGCFTLPVVNAFSERLVLASPNGLVVSLAPPVTVADARPQAPVPEDPAATPP